jgi:beta-galactosidase
MTDDLKSTLAQSDAEVVLSPRSGARDARFCIPTPLPPAFPGLDVTVSRVESLRPDMSVHVLNSGAVHGYREELKTSAELVLADAQG